MKNKIITAAEAAEMIKDGSSVMVGGFMGNGTPESIMDALVARDAKDLTVICNDGAFGPQFDADGNEVIWNTQLDVWTIPVWWDSDQE